MTNRIYDKELECGCLISTDSNLWLPCCYGVEDEEQILLHEKAMLNYRKLENKKMEGERMSLVFSDDGFEEYLKLRMIADNYLNKLIMLVGITMSISILDKLVIKYRGEEHKKQQLCEDTTTKNSL